MTIKATGYGRQLAINNSFPVIIVSFLPDVIYYQVGRLEGVTVFSSRGVAVVACHHGYSSCRQRISTPCGVYDADRLRQVYVPRQAPSVGLVDNPRPSTQLCRRTDSIRQQPSSYRCRFVREPDRHRSELVSSGATYQPAAAHSRVRRLDNQ